MRSPQDTIAALATPLGEGGLGVIRMSGAGAIARLQTLFRSAKDVDLSAAPSHTCHVGTIIQPSPALRRPDEGIVDQVVVTLFRAPHSYTGEDVVEISAHGNPFTLQKILSLCCQNGVRLAGPGEFTERAFLNGKMDLTQAEAVADLIHAKTGKAQTAALAQLQGRLAERVRGLRDQLLPLLAHVEVGLDHADEEHDFITRSNLMSRCQAVQDGMDQILRSARVGKILREGLRVSLVGRPNVGKSSLLNALLQEDRAIVSSVPGTTRDTLQETVQWNGLPLVLTDTAGLRGETTDPIERLGMERTRRSVVEADVVVALFDGSAPMTTEDDAVMTEAASRPHLWAVNKSDLSSPWSNDTLQRMIRQAPLVRLSAKTGEGLDLLLKTVTMLALGEKATASEAEWILNRRHQAALERARYALSQATAVAGSDSFEECVALELQTALQALGEIIGETTTDDLLGEIFSTFCVGK